MRFYAALTDKYQIILVIANNKDEAIEKIKKQNWALDYEWGELIKVPVEPFKEIIQFIELKETPIDEYYKYPRWNLLISNKTY